MILVDVQYDFMEAGRLPVDGGRRVARSIADHLRRDDYDHVICTLDWHPVDHCSFIDNGGQWPPHCTMHSHGAALHNTVLRVLEQRYQGRVTMITKGSDPQREEYSFLQNEDNRAAFARILQSLGDDVKCHLAGIAGDVCVMNTAKDLLGMGLDIVLHPWLVASINAATFESFINDNNLPTQ